MATGKAADNRPARSTESGATATACRPGASGSVVSADTTHLGAADQTVISDFDGGSWVIHRRPWPVAGDGDTTEAVEQDEVRLTRPRGQQGTAGCSWVEDQCPTMRWGLPERSLSRSSFKMVEGTVVSTWTPRSYAVQTDLSGGVSGAQASRSIPWRRPCSIRCCRLIDGLYPLDPASDAAVTLPHSKT